MISIVNAVYLFTYRTPPSGPRSTASIFASSSACRSTYLLGKRFRGKTLIPGRISAPAATLLTLYYPRANQHPAETFGPPAARTQLRDTNPSPKCERVSYETNRCAVVSRVIDGDTVELSTGERVRFIGMDTPERGEAGFDAATERTAALVGGKTVTLDVCEEKAKDRYGRTLAYVIVGATVVNEVLLREGHATPLHIPPCGNHTATCYEALASTVAATGRRPLANLSGLIQK